MSRGRVVATMLLAGVALGVLGWRMRGSNEIDVRTVVLLTLDTVRADRLGCYGGAPDLTPTLDRLAREGVRFERALTTAPITLPAHASILSGSDPIAHGVRVNGAFTFSADNPTIALALQRHGFTTGAFVSATVLDRRYGLAEGFDVYESRMAGRDGTFDPSPHERRGERTVDEALRFVADNKLSRLFLWVHLFDAHAPYAAPEPFASRHADAYDAEVAYMDHCIQQLLDGLQQHGRLEDVLIAVVADHGEGLGDHGESTHTIFTYDSTLRVPMIVWAPGRLPAGHVVEQGTSITSLAPTLLDLLGVPKPPGMYGPSRVLAVRDGVAADEAALYFESLAGPYYYGFLPITGIEWMRRKLIDIPDPGRRELYFTGEDPAEARDRSAGESKVLRDLKGRLELHQRTHQTARSLPRAMSAAETEAFTQLGYVASLKVGDGAMDPKDGIALVEELIQCALLAGSDARAAEARLRAFVRSHADVAEARELLGSVIIAQLTPGAHDAVARLRDAEASMRRASELRDGQDPDTEVEAALIALMLANALRTEAGERGAPLPEDEIAALVRDAERRCARALELEITHVKARVVLARKLLLRDGQVAQAKRLLDEVIDGDIERGIPANGDDAESRFLRAQCLMRGGDLANLRLALKDLQDGLRLDPANLLYQEMLGDIHAALIQPKEAAAAYRRALELDPDARLRAQIVAKLEALPL